MGVPISCDYVQFYVEDVCRASDELISQYGFTDLLPGNPAQHTGAPARSAVLGQGRIVVVLTEPLGEGPAREFLTLHGDGLARIGFSCADARSVYARAVHHGARVLAPPQSAGDFWMAMLSGFGDVVHTLVEQPMFATTILLPGIGEIPRRATQSTVGLFSIDHFAVCVPAGELMCVVDYYVQAWGFEKIFEEKIECGLQAMNSAVVASPGRGVVLTLIEPASAELSQIDHFLKHHGGTGVQHMALRTHDIVATVAELGTRGVAFGHTPATYYTGLVDRVGPVHHDQKMLHELGILVDNDHAGTLFQIFTQSRHSRGTYFTEIIERNGAITFGSNNIKALFEAKQREIDACATEIPTSR